MNTLTMPREAATTAPRKGPATPRLDLYGPIHKALRLFMTDTLGKVGWLDVDDTAEVAATLAQVQSLLDLCRAHLEHENRFVHSAMEARKPGASVRIAREHEHHRDVIAALEAEAAALRALPNPPAAQRFYRHLALFIGDNFAHMNTEETVHNAELWAAYSDADLADVHERLLASIDPAEMGLVLRWMVPALSPSERAGMLGALQQQLPREAMQGVLDIVRPHLDDTAWAKLARALGVAPVPGLVGV